VTVRLTFLGVRGSTPAPGPDFLRYGGHTSCLVVAAGPDSPPVLALDAGTGLRSLTGLLQGAPYSGSILLSHLHWDHVQGIPFFAAGDRADARVDVVMPEESGRSGRDLVAQFMSPPAFPISPEGLKGQWSFRAAAAGPFTAEGFDVLAFEVEHKGGRTFGYRVQAAGAAFAYVPDHAPSAGVNDAALAALDGVDVLIHDAQFLDPERPRAVDYGHATVDEAVTLAEDVGAGSLVLFHHGPHRTDGALDRIAEEYCTSSLVVMAREGMVLDLP
jgi:phosphoribosyl 1,2-cyclic phosphodiesterase